MALALAGTLTAGPPAAAQINPFGGRGAGGFALVEEDLRRMNEAAAPLYRADPPPPIGTETVWSNPETGNGGTVTLLEAFERDGLPCRRLGLDIVRAGRADPTPLTSTACRLADGTWRFGGG